MTSELIAENRKINLYLNGDITICSSHRRSGQDYNVNRKFASHARKGYRIKKSTRRSLVSSAFLLFVKKQHQIVFLTLTFPEKVKKGIRINPMLNKFITNLKKNYGLKGFLWTRENTKQGRPHFHILADMPYQPIQKINNAWCAACKMQSKNAVRLPKDHKAILKDIEKTAKYVTKYITKNEKEYFSERCYSISRDIKAEPIRLSEFDLRQLEIDQGKNMKFRYYEHVTTVKIWDFFKNSDYFIEFLGNYAVNNEYLYGRKDQPKTIDSCNLTTERVLPLSFQAEINFSP